MLNNSAATVLLETARQAIHHAVRHQSYTPPPREENALNQRVGCFVTLKINHRLRGCIGNFQSRKPLFREVADMAVAAATQDPRFPPLQEEELEQIHLEITVLSPLEKISDPADIIVGEHGIYLEKGFHRGVLLPQVATEHNWDRLTFLRQTCIKAGLPDNAWQSPDADIYRFSGLIISETDTPEQPQEHNEGSND